MAANNDHLVAQYNLANLYFINLNNNILALKFYTKAADRGHYNSQFMTSYLYYKSNETELSNKYFDLYITNYEFKKILKI